MEASGCCKNCRRKQIIRDEDSGALVCQACGVQQEFDNFQAHFHGRNDAVGTFVRVGSSSQGGDFDYKEKKLYLANQKILEITSRLGFSSSTTDKVKHMMGQITDGELGEGNWFPIFTSACCYVVVRQNNLPYSMAEIAAGIGCDLHELGRMVIRVVDNLSLDLPEFDIILYFERAIKSCSSFSEVSKQILDKMIKLGRLLLNCSVKWFLTTGRQPVPVVVAVLVFVAELNQVEVSLEKVAKEIHAGVDTSRKRHKELKETLVKVAQALPWGKNVTVKNIVQNAPFVIQYIEIKSRLETGKKRKISQTGGLNLEETVSGCLQKEAAHDMASTGSDSPCFELESGNRISERASFDDLDTVKISQEVLSNIYKKFSSDNDFVKSVDEGGHDFRSKMKKGFSLQVRNKWRAGETDLSKKLFLKEILEKNEVFNALPPSFVAGELACIRRREKIKAAKQRINEIMQPSNPGASNNEVVTYVKCEENRKKRRRKAELGNVDWEDNIIEILVLHQVKEEEIEQGHYKRMLDLYVFGSENTCKIFR